MSRVIILARYYFGALLFWRVIILAGAFDLPHPVFTLFSAIADGALPVFVQGWMMQQVDVAVLLLKLVFGDDLLQFPDKQYPAWVVEALASVDINLKN